MMEEEAKQKLKTAELQAKKDRLRMWTNYVPPPSNSKAIHNQNFSGKVNIAQSFIYAKQSVFIHINISHFNLSFTGG